MRIRAFHIDSFGLLKDITLEGLPRGLAIFLGHNEAGKSTLLDFFRSTLTGYPYRPRDLREKAYVADGQTGGSLELDTAQGVVRLTRRPGVFSGEPTLTDAAGNPLDVTVWDRLLGSVTRDVYTSVYGFSLRELQEFSTLTTDEVRNALYGASFGMGLRSPGRVLKQLEGEMEKLFKPAGSKQSIPLALKAWEDIKKRLRQVEEEAVRYDELTAERDQLADDLKKDRLERAALEAERRMLERRLNVWQQWEEWRLAGVRLERMDVMPATFPADGPSRLERAVTHGESAERNVTAAAERLARTRAARAACHVDGGLVEAAGALRALSENKSSCRNALVEIPRLLTSLTRMDEELGRLLATLGPDWDLQRVQRVACPLPVREDLGRRAEAMQQAASEHAMTVQGHERAQSDVHKAEQDLQAARAVHETLPTPVADLGEDDRDALREHLTRTHEALHRLPDREKALSLARSEFGRAVGHLHLRPRHSTAEALTALSEAQETALAMAGDVLARMSEAAEVKQQAERAKDAEEQSRDRLVRVQSQKDGLGDPNRVALEGRRTGLRALRNVLSQLSVEENRLQENQERLAVHLADSPDAGRNPVLIAAGSVFAAGGAGLIAALKVWGITAVTVTPELVVPLVLWHGYLVLLAGLAFVAAGLPRNKPEAARHAIVAEQLRRREEAALQKTLELATERDRLCAVAGVTDLYPEALDALEAELDRERDQCAAGERLEQELTAHADDLASLRQRAQWQETEFVRKNAEAQNAKRRWHEYIMELGVQSVPSADGAAAFFARVDSARAVWTQVASLEKEVAEMEGRGAQLAAVARERLPDHAWPDSWANLDQVMDAVRLVLESCRKADLAAEERVRSAEAVRGCEARLVRENENLEATCLAVTTAEAHLCKTEKAWQLVLEHVGLLPHLSPSTAHEALLCVDRILSLDGERDRLWDSLSHQERERDAFLAPLQTLAMRLGRLPQGAAEGESVEPAQWLALFDVLMAESDAACQTAGEARRLDTVLAEEESEWRAATAVYNDARQSVDKLLQLAGATDAEDFLRRHEIRVEREALVRRREGLEDALRLAAGETPFDRFVSEFAQIEKDVLEERVEAILGRVAVLAEEDVQTSDVVRTLALRLEQLASSDTLAQLRLQESAVLESVQQLAREWGRFALARNMVLVTKRRFEQERQPDVIRIASALFSTITGQMWSSVSASLEDSSLRVLPPFGEPVAPEFLSRGTQEQLYLSLRLAHIRNHAMQTTALPVIMDDILVNFDPERSERTARVLVDMTRSGEVPGGQAVPGHQMFYFTCHPHTAHLLQEVAPESVLYGVNRGRIEAL